MNYPDAKISELAMETQVDASPQATWTALTDGIAGWWPDDFYSGGEAGARRFLLEAVPGGRMCEEWRDGGGVLWAQVVTVEPARRLQVVGYAFPNYGGPSQWFGTWDLEARDGGTRLRFSEHAIGRVSEDYAREKHRGWTFLWQALAAHVEGREAPAWQD